MPLLPSLEPAGGYDVEYITSRDRARRQRSSSSCTVGRVEEPDFEELFDEEVIDLTVDDNVNPKQRLLGLNELALSHFRVSGFVAQTGDLIEVKGTKFGSHEVDFVRIRIVARDIQTGSTIIRGIPFIRTRKLEARLPKKPNEICMILHHHRDDRTEEAPLLVDVHPDFVIQRRKLIITNSLWPKFSNFQSSLIEGTRDPEGRRAVFEESTPLVCRWQLRVYYTMQGQKTKPEEEALVRIDSSHIGDSDAQFLVNEDSLRNKWRGGHVKGGSWCANDESLAINLESGSPPPARTIRGANQKYTVFDSFSGAGGLSRGVTSAGLKVTFAVDRAAEVWDTYSTNFPDTTLYKMRVDEFITASKDQLIRTDILHLSPPCQFFSPAHTQASANDDENIFALFACKALIDKTRPRLITLEQTFGITHERHLKYLRSLLGDFTQLGYSVRWRVVKLCTWGSAQDRKRLILIAAGPGEKLPPFPEATHSQDGEGGLKPFTTIRQAISGIRRGDDSHDLNRTRRHRPRRAPYNPDRLAMTITTGGGESHYPDGTRDFTLREFASLQGFPRHHRFRGNRTSVRRQIGNAFPPNTVRVLYNHLDNWLLKEDGMRRPDTPQDVVMLDDDLLMEDVLINDVVIVDDESDESMVDYASYSEHDESPEIDDDVMEISESPRDEAGPQDDPDVIDLT